MSWTLFRANIRDNRTIWIIMTAVFCFYISIMVGMFDPAGAEKFLVMMEMMPEALLKAFGMAQIGSTLVSFIAGSLYCGIVFLFPLVVSIVVNHRLMASHVDKGSMAYLLATPNTRTKIASTQALFSLASITALFTVATTLGIVVSGAMFPGHLETGKFIMLNIYALLTYFAIGGIGFFASCIANESKHSLGIGIGLPGAFLVLQMVGAAGDKFSWLGNLSLYALFDPFKLLEGDSFAYIGMALLALIAAALYIGGIAIFNKRDLHV
ncbi:MAG: hypothetical protein FD169_1216 [Bacillota bacterium]|nr:MAG: hypothetical protein FD169_1216 [Bacillota bacterium]